MTVEQIETLASETIEGIAPEFRAELIEETLAQYLGAADDAEAVSDLMQNIAASRRYPLS